MRAIVVFGLVLVAVVASSKVKSESRGIEIKVLESENVAEFLSLIVEATEYAFDTGLTAEGRMTLLENQLVVKISGYSWFVSEGTDAVAHTSKTYVYLRVLDGLIPHRVNIVAC
nr:uncharacterized protein LOC111421534 [Onthophagus taurus]